MLREYCDNLAEVHDRAWARYAWGKEILNGKIRFEDYFQEYWPRAVSEGIHLAAEYDGRTPSDIAQELGLSVIMRQQEPGQMSYEFALFNEPDEIEIFATIASEGQMVIDSLEEERFSAMNVVDILLAHEVFHALQSRKPDLFVNQKHIVLWKVLGHENRSSLTSLEEVAAMSFARQLLHLEVTPYILDFILCLSRAPQRAKEIYNAVMQYEGETSR